MDRKCKQKSINNKSFIENFNLTIHWLINQEIDRNDMLLMGNCYFIYTI